MINTPRPLPLKIIFLGSTQFSKDLLNYLLEAGLNISHIFSIPQEFTISYSEEKVKNYNFCDLREIAEEKGISYSEIEGKSGKNINDYYNEIAAIQPDVILVMGWYYIIPKKIRELAKYGTWGIHASLLPKYAGGAPLVWAIINGEKESGVSLFKLGDGVDDGDIIAQEKITIAFEDTIREVYEKATSTSKEMLLNALQNIDKICYVPQDKSKIEYWPQRKPTDGELDLRWSAEKIYNFIRAQAPPYPGAFIKTIDGHKIIIEKARIE